MESQHVMHRIVLVAAVAAFGALSATVVFAERTVVFAQSMTVTSAEMSDGSVPKNEQVANVFGCKGDNISPSLSWSGAPSDTKSFAITILDANDPALPAGAGFWHWVVFNIPASTTSIPKDAGNVKRELMPEGTIQIRNDFGFDGYGGPCPPSGDKPHHYTLTVYAVDLDKIEGATTKQPLGSLASTCISTQKAKPNFTGPTAVEPTAR